MLNLIGIIEKKNKKNRFRYDAGIDEMNCWLPFIRDIKKYEYKRSVFLNTLNELRRVRKSFLSSINNNIPNSYQPNDSLNELIKRIWAVDFLINYLESHKWEISN